MTVLNAGDTGPYVDRLLGEMSSELLFSKRPGDLCRWLEARGVRPSLAAVIAERARRTETTRRKGGPTKKGTK